MASSACAEVAANRSERPHQPAPELHAVVARVLVAAVDLAVGDVEVAGAAHQEQVFAEVIAGAEAGLAVEVEMGAELRHRRVGEADPAAAVEEDRELVQLQEVKSPQDAD